MTDLFGAGNVHRDCPISLMLGVPCNCLISLRLECPQRLSKVPEAVHVYCYCQPETGGCDCNQFEAGVSTATV